MRKIALLSLLLLVFTGFSSIAQEDQASKYHYNEVYDYASDTNAIVSFNLDSLLVYAGKYIGTPYVSPGRSPEGFDCSGFTFYCFKRYGIFLPYSAHQQAEIGTEIPLNKVMAGDLLFFKGSDLGDNAVHHVGLAVSNYSTKKGEAVKFIHAASHGLKYENLSCTYYQGRFLKARRVQ